jgi:hypothetical protein
MFSKLIGTHKVPSVQQKYERFPRGQQSPSPKKGLLSVTPENNGLFALYTPDMGILWFASMREHRSNWPRFAVFSASSAGEANTAD